MACCDEFLLALNEGTDNEGWMPLISIENGRWDMGLDLPPLNFCPWCGKKLENP